MLHKGTAEESDFQRVYRQHVDAVYRVCFGFMKNNADAEDAVQETFLKLLQCSAEQSFESASHERAWLIVTASNICKNHLRSWTRQKRKEMESFEELPDSSSAEQGNQHVLEAVLKLPDKYKTVIYLFYYEEYSCSDIAAALGKKETTIRSHLKRGRAILERTLGGEADES
ncbi:MAG: RNA polymerase sigma factor [Ruminococcus sp.]|nr:RNA polymerase sigma factor [Ruminococcus sp.]